MAARFTRSLVLFALLGLAGGDAVGLDETTAKATALAGENMMRTFIALSETIESCNQKSKLIELPHRDELGVTREELLAAVVYFSLKSENECIAQAAKDFFLATRVVEKGMREVMSEKNLKESLALVDMILDDWWKEMEAKARYELYVSTASRAKLKKLPNLRERFDMIRSWEASGN